MTIRNRIVARLHAVGDGFDRYLAPWAGDVQRMEAHRAEIERIRAEAGNPREEERTRAGQWAELDSDQRLDHLTERAAEMAENPWSVSSVLAVMEGTGVPVEDREKAGQIAVERFGLDAADWCGAAEQDAIEAEPGDEVVDVAGTIEPSETGGYTVQTGGTTHQVADVAEGLALLTESEQTFVRYLDAREHLAERDDMEASS